MKTILLPIVTARTAAEQTAQGTSVARLSGAVVAAAGGTAILAVLGMPAPLAFLAGLVPGLLIARGAGAAEPAASAIAGEEAGTREPGHEAAARALVDALPTPLVFVAANGRVVHANPAAVRDLPRLAVGAHNASVIRAPDFVAAVARTLEDGQEQRVTFAASPGRERFLEARISALAPNSPFGPEARIVVQVEDRTEQVRTDQLRSDFIANASHELRTPLASIIGYIETLQNHAKDDPTARERFLGIMGREAARMHRLVDDLMSLSRIELSEHVRPQSPCAISTIAAEAAAALAPLARSEGVTIEVAVPAESPLVPGDRDQLYQVFSNLIDNAIKYGGRGAVVRVKAAEPSRAFPGRIGVTVEDSGPGIPREHLPRLTERFYRANVGASRTKGGTGLGLAIVKHILNRHQGKLEIVSTLGQGSAFTVWLPRGDKTA